MRIWSLHPKYLDAKALVALWRETLLAKHVLKGKTKGYTNHPQLHRFKKLKRPVEAIDHYLSEIYQEALSRGYQFDNKKIDWGFKRTKIRVTHLQVEYEFGHLLKKLYKRDRKKHREIKMEKIIIVHPLFTVVEGEVEEWERV